MSVDRGTTTSGNGLQGADGLGERGAHANNGAGGDVSFGLSPTIGRVATPPHLEATSDEFCFWVPEGTPIEKTQLVCTTASFSPHRDVTFYGVVEEVARRSRRRDVLEERDRYDGRVETQTLLESDGVTYARVRTITSSPLVLTPPREESPVRLAGPDDARVAYAVHEMHEPMPFGLLKNGATADAGPAMLDLADLLGLNGGHLNINGIPGIATKSSALLTTLCCLLHHVHTRPRRNVEPLSVVPVILNVKSTDLLFLDRHGRDFRLRVADNTATWKRIGIPEPTPFAGAASPRGGIAVS